MCRQTESESVSCPSVSCPAYSWYTFVYMCKYCRTSWLSKAANPCVNRQKQAVYQILTSSDLCCAVLCCAAHCFWGIVGTDMRGQMQWPESISGQTRRVWCLATVGSCQARHSSCLGLLVMISHVQLPFLGMNVIGTQESAHHMYCDVNLHTSIIHHTLLCCCRHFLGKELHPSSSFG